MRLYKNWRRPEPRTADPRPADPCVIRLPANGNRLLTGGDPPRVIIFPDRVTAAGAALRGKVDGQELDRHTPIEIISTVRWKDRPPWVR